MVIGRNSDDSVAGLQTASSDSLYNGQKHRGEDIMWLRQCDFDAQEEAPPPITTRIASNEEFIPPAQSCEQKKYEACVADISECSAKRQGISRRDFMRSGSGMAAALLALNQVFGPCFEVDV